MDRIVVQMVLAVVVEEEEKQEKSMHTPKDRQWRRVTGLVK